MVYNSNDINHQTHTLDLANPMQQAGGELGFSMEMGLKENMPNTEAEVLGELYLYWLVYVWQGCTPADRIKRGFTRH